MPQDVLADGFVRLCIDPNLNFYEGKCRMLLEGQYVVNNALATPIVADKPLQIDTPRYIDQLFTAGSVLAEALKKAFCTCPEGTIFTVIPRLDAAGSVKAVYTLTVTGPATSDGVIDIWLGEQEYSISVEVADGDTASTVASAIAAAIPAQFPYVATVSAGVVTLTARNGGTVGNHLSPIINWRARMNYFPSGIAIAVARPTAGSVDPAPIDYAAALGDCCYNCYALLSSNTAWQDGMRDWIRSQWSCDTPQCFGHGFTYNTGSKGAILATGDNSPEWSRLAVPANDPSFPWLLVAEYAAKRCCTACSNPELSIQGPVHGALICSKRPTSCVQPWEFEDAEELKEAGFVVYGPLVGGSGSLTSPYIHNDVTNYLYDDLNRPNFTFRDVNSRYLTAATAVKIAEQLRQSQGLALYTRQTKVPVGVFGTNPNMIRASIVSWARSQVGFLFSVFENEETDIVLKTDFEVKPNCLGKPGRLHLFFRYRQPERLDRITVTTQPKLLDNCVR